MRSSIRQTDRAAPVVQHKRDLVQPQRLHQGRQVSDTNLQSVVVGAAHRLRAAESPQIGHEHPMGRPDQRPDESLQR